MICVIYDKHRYKYYAIPEDERFNIHEMCLLLKTYYDIQKMNHIIEVRKKQNINRDKIMTLSEYYIDTVYKIVQEVMSKCSISP